ncbi:MAG TPA: hypothetical protein VGH95_05500 [Candidatus Aquirickettsiella sp.]|jgi:hypothetical protein
MQEHTDKKDKIILLLEESIKLLSKNNQKRWAEGLMCLMRHYIKSDNKQEAASLIKKLYGGAGTLNDVVLHKDRKPLIEENNQLEKLLNELYDECNKKMMK